MIFSGTRFAITNFPIRSGVFANPEGGCLGFSFNSQIIAESTARLRVEEGKIFPGTKFAITNFCGRRNLQNDDG